tara:strand:+ start:13045 stop:13359 length:315 start_codon:yes stop_codon:yes gene_type:complete
MAKITVLSEDGKETLIDLPKVVGLGETIELTVGDEGGDHVQVRVTTSLFSSKKLYRDEEWLRNAYTVENKTMAELGSLFDVSPMTICTWLERFGIETRSRGRRS